MTRTVFKRSQGYQEQKLMNPAREWVIGISILIGIVIVAGVFDAREYFKYNSLASEIEGKTIEIKKYRHSVAERARQSFDARLQQFNQLKSQIPTVLPPVVLTASSTATTTPEVSSETQTEADAVDTPAVTDVVSEETAPTSTLSIGE